MRQYFLTGTDTDIGKTHVACLLLRAAALHEKTTLGLKPIAAGGECMQGQMQNDDALALMAASTVKLPYASINPICLDAPLSPHIAAAKQDIEINLHKLVQSVQDSLSLGCDFVVVEGAGGWRVPFSNTHTLADLAIELKMPVILVVGMRLGCLNHALLSVEAIKADGLEFAGWVANCIDPSMLALDENIQTLKNMIDVPCLGIVPFEKENSSESALTHINISKVL